jgi:protein TonB
MRLVIASATLLVILSSACQRGAPETSQIAHAADPTPSQAAVPQIDPTLSVEDLRDRAAAALQAGRLLAPAAESALDLYLAAGERAPGDSEIRSAIEFLQPYALIACEQAIAGGDLPEAQRLLELLQRSNPAAPSLPRLRVTLAKAEAVAKTNAVAAIEAATRQAAAEEAAAQQLSDAARSTSDRPRLSEIAVSTPVLATADVLVPATTPDPVARAAERQNATRVADVLAAQGKSASPEAISVPTPPRAAGMAAVEAAEETSRVRGANTGAAVEAGAGSALPRILRAGAPRYPVIAMSRKIEGEVEVAFTILPDGRVSNARVTRAKPAGVFDRAALSAVEGYLFAPGGRSFDTSRTVSFRLSGI